VADLMAILRNHGDDRLAPRYDLLTGGLSAPCVHPGGLVVSSQTTASWVSELRHDGARHWATATAAPCTSLYKPVRVDDPLLLGPTPTDVADPDSLWWRHERLHRRVMCNPARLLPLLADERDEVERGWLADSPQPGEAFAEGDNLLDRWTEAVLTEKVRDVRPPLVKRFWRSRDRRAHLE
jgi:dipeptidase